MVEKTYRVSGNFRGTVIDDIIVANSKKQAKLRSGFANGFGGMTLKPFIKSSSIKVSLA